MEVKIHLGNVINLIIEGLDIKYRLLGNIFGIICT